MRITHVTQFSPKKMREKDTLIQQMLRVFALMAFWSYLLLPSTIDQIYSKEEIGETQSKASDSILYNIYIEKRVETNTTIVTQPTSPSNQLTHIL